MTCGIDPVGKPSPKRGVAALTIVMLLFFVMAMVTAYANRMLIYEQKISSNLFRIARATHSADAGMDWIVSELNSGVVDASCNPSTNAADLSVRQRLAGFNPNTGMFAPVRWTFAGSTLANVTMTCFETTNVTRSLVCSCPVAASPSFNAPDRSSILVFSTQLQFRDPTQYQAIPNSLHVIVRGCSNLDTQTNCDPNYGPSSADAFIDAQMTLGFLSALPKPPPAALTVSGAVTATAGTLTVANTYPGSGITIHSGGAVAAASSRYYLPPGAANGDGVVQSDSSLTDMATAHSMATGVFGMPLGNYHDLTSSYKIQCTGATCSPLALDQAANLNPGLIVYSETDLTLDGSIATLGSPTQPVLLVVDGTLTVSGAVNFYGFIYAKSVAWTAGAGSAAIVGALMVEGDFNSSGNVSISYDNSILTAINKTYGTFSRISGSWVTQ